MRQFAESRLSSSHAPHYCGDSGIFVLLSRRHLLVHVRHALHVAEHAVLELGEAIEQAHQVLTAEGVQLAEARRGGRGGSHGVVDDRHLAEEVAVVTLLEDHRLHLDIVTLFLPHVLVLEEDKLAAVDEVHVGAAVALLEEQLVRDEHEELVGQHVRKVDQELVAQALEKLTPREEAGHDRRVERRAEGVREVVPQPIAARRTPEVAVEVGDVVVHLGRHLVLCHKALHGIKALFPLGCL
mmetsp:Transcript_70473/g.197016  ORF Transcript_70473/g.197016 Transcript_70473/m.197016 type:complete len:240 (+) Transcript_70473:475-1194(+)